MKVLVSILFLLIGLQGLVKAEDVYFELPNLHGYYSWAGGETHRGDTLTYSGPTVTVRAVRINLWGRTTTGLMECCMPEYPYHCETYSWGGLDFRCLVKRPPDQGEWSQSTTIGGSNDFELVLDFSSSNGFNILVDGDMLIVDMYIQPAGFPGGSCFDIWPPEAEIDSTQFLLDVDDVTPTEPSSWGRIKALYGVDR